MYPPRLALLLAITAMGVSLPRARACSRSGCRPLLFAPPAGTAIPADAPALAIRGNSPYNSWHWPLPQVFTLVGPDGTERSLSATRFADARSGLLDEQAVLPVDGLTPGTYSVRYDDACVEREIASPGEARTVTFDVVAATGRPSLTGTLKPGDAALRGRTVTTLSGGCTVTMSDVRTLALVFEPSEQLRPFLGVTAFELEVDDAVWSATPFGASPSAVSPESFLHDRKPLEVYRICGTGSDDPSSAPVEGLSKGPHRLALHAFIAGVA